MAEPDFFEEAKTFVASVSETEDEDYWAAVQSAQWQLERAFAKGQVDEREECAKICDDMIATVGKDFASAIAKLIRARAGEKNG